MWNYGAVIAWRVVVYSLQRPTKKLFNVESYTALHRILPSTYISTTVRFVVARGLWEQNDEIMALKTEPYSTNRQPSFSIFIFHRAVLRGSSNESPNDWNNNMIYLTNIIVN